QLTTIGEYAFAFIDELTSIDIPASITTIGKRAFSECGLTNITFGENSQLTTIGEWAFSANRKLTSITIPGQVVEIGSWAFRDCDCLAEVYNYSSLPIEKGGNEHGEVARYALDMYTTDEPSKLTTDEDGFIIHTSGNVKTLVGYIGTDKDVLVPDGIVVIGNSVFYDMLYGYVSHVGMTSITIPGSVTVIGAQAFNGCGDLVDVYYMGTEILWNKIEIDWGNDYLLNATIHYSYNPEAE
ncbi:MAG: leucine-rich repeat domain-containing protein, partial [Clostridia bacterium]|nr:leucine-rich repeat domain-containing protein [Clostridia bacterium]